jgi:hypothetical protein
MNFSFIYARAMIKENFLEAEKYEKTPDGPIAGNIFAGMHRTFRKRSNPQQGNRR